MDVFSNLFSHSRRKQRHRTQVLRESVMPKTTPFTDRMGDVSVAFVIDDDFKHVCDGSARGCTGRDLERVGAGVAKGSVL